MTYYRLVLKAIEVVCESLLSEGLLINYVTKPEQGRGKHLCYVLADLYPFPCWSKARCPNE